MRPPAQRAARESGGDGSAGGPTPPRASRIGIIGARRVRQGLGPFVARELVASGAEVPCLLGTGESSARAAAETLARDFGIDARPYTDLEQMLGAERLDGLAILAPHAAHAQFLEHAAEAGLHAFCEKPLVWGGERPAARARAIAERFTRAGLVLFENCQWPWMLAAYAALYPGRTQGVPGSFRMQLAPESEAAVGMLVDAMHHPLSCLQALAPSEHSPRLEEPRFRFVPGARDAGRQPRLELRFCYRTAERGVDVEIVLERSASLPRPAGLGWDGGWAERSVRPPGYTIYLAAGDRAVKAPDPLGVQVDAFVREVQESRAARGAEEARRASQRHERIRRDIVQRMEALEALVRAYEAQAEPQAQQPEEEQ